MKSDIRVAAPPAKPLMVFDGECNFCTLWIRRWQHLTGDDVDYLPSQDAGVTAQFPEIPRERFAEAVQFIEMDGAVFSGAEAVFRALAKNPRHQWALKAYENLSAGAGFTEWAYRFVAENRMLFSRLTRWFWGRHVEPPNHLLARWFFLRALGVIYLIAFVSLWTQISGLIGHNGILPSDQFMSAVAGQCNAQNIGLERFHLLPTLCWFDSSDSFLQFQCAAGTVLSALLIFGITPVPCLALLWLFYLSLVTVGRDFLAFQWDNLLLETGFLAIFLAPLRWLPKPSKEAPPSRTVIWLLRLLLFKLLFMSGSVKLLSGDPNWRNLTALTFHYQTQPLPVWTAWYMNLLPLWLQKLSCAGTLAVELGAPLLIFAPRRLRFLGCALLAGLQILIALTGNYTFFNWLSLALCLLLLDDFAIQKVLPKRFSSPLSCNFKPATFYLRLRWPRSVIFGLTVINLSISLFLLAAMFNWRPAVFAPIEFAAAELSPFRSLNSYGLFAVMTTKREEIIVEGSNDGTNWLAYEFRHKPGDVNRRPDFIAPFQPRLDWQMWFAALGNYPQNPWFKNLCLRLLQGSPEVLALLETNPFPGKPPRYIRAELYDYHFTSLAERRSTAAWWRREFSGEYLPTISLHE